MISTYLGPRIVATLSGLCRYFLPSPSVSPEQSEMPELWPDPLCLLVTQLGPAAQLPRANMM